MIPFALVEAFVAPYPIVPLRLFAVRNVVLSAVINFFLGFSLFTLSIFLPVWFQVIDFSLSQQLNDVQTILGESATISGLQMLPTMFGLVISSGFFAYNVFSWFTESTTRASGILVTKYGHYKIYPIIGTLMSTLASFLLVLWDENSGQGIIIPILLLLGLGFGLSIQLVTVIAQNAVDFKDMAVSTSTVSFFRTMGGVFGVTIAATIITDVSQQLMDEAIAANQVPDATKLFAATMSKMFLYIAPFAAAGIPFSIAVKQIPLRQTVESLKRKDAVESA